MKVDIDEIEIDEAETLIAPRSHRERGKQTDSPGKDRRSKRISARILADMIEHEDKTGAVAMGAGSGFVPTFHAARHERAWLIDSVVGFHDSNLILDVLTQVKGGKEANVYCCAAHPTTGVEHLAAKVYRPRVNRTLKNDAAYREGTGPVDEQGKSLVKKRDLRAVANKTGYGREILHGTWLYNEYKTMTRLYQGGVPVPKPYALGPNSILMEYLGEPGAPAPALDQVALSHAEASQLFDLLIDSVSTMLKINCVHADLSAYNVLYWEGEVRIIDFPQAVDPVLNPSAYLFFARDVKRLCQYFGRFGIRNDPAALTRSLWATHVPGRGEDIQGELLARVNTHEIH